MSKAVFTRKSIDIEEVKERAGREEPKCEYVIEKVIELPANDYLAFSEYLLVDSAIIKEHLDKMYVDADGVWHCILVKANGGSEGILVESEGYDYARYTAYLPDCGGNGHAQ